MHVGMDCETEGLREGPAPYVVALFDTRSGEPATFLDKGDDSHLIRSLDAMEMNKDRLCTFNGTQFDFRMIAAACTNRADQRRCAVLALEHVDIMLQYACDKGYFGSLNSFACCTLDAKKIGSGADVREDWAAGKHQEVADYCADDARLTAELMDFGSRNGYLLREPKSRPGTTTRWGLGRSLWQPAAVCLRNPARATFMDDPPNVAAMADWTLQYL